MQRIFICTTYIYNISLIFYLILRFIPAGAMTDMTSLMLCHHFTAQHVLSVEDEPLVVCGAGNDLFVATACCSISHYLVAPNASEQCQFVGSFPSVAVVDKMAYSEKGE